MQFDAIEGIIENRKGIVNCPNWLAAFTDLYIPRVRCRRKLACPCSSLRGASQGRCLDHRERMPLPEWLQGRGFASGSGQGLFGLLRCRSGLPVTAATPRLQCLQEQLCCSP